MKSLIAWVLCSALVLPPVAGAAENLERSQDTAPLIGCSAAGQVAEQDTFVTIGEIEQWVTVRGTNCSNPVVLILHGGPGNPMSPFSDAIYGAWKDEVTLVQWDQRGAGRTFGRNPSAADETLSVERMAQDGVELAERLAERFQQDKVVLLGGSWGSVLGVKMIRARPDLFHAWVGSSQLVNSIENQEDSYRRVLALAREAGDDDAVGSLEGMGPPPWTNPGNVGALRRLTRRYEARTATPSPSEWWVPSVLYATEEAAAEREAGEEFSYLQFVGLNGDGMLSGIDLFAADVDFAVPVFLIQGEDDLVTTRGVSERYFAAITAPEKDYLLVPAAGHDPNRAMIEAQHAILKDRILPMIR